MSMDRSLKTASSLTRHRNVLTRAERLAKLTDEERWQDGKTVFGLPKVSNRNVKVGKKEKKKDEAAEGATAAAPGERPLRLAARPRGRWQGPRCGSGQGPGGRHEGCPRGQGRQEVTATNVDGRPVPARLRPSGTGRGWHGLAAA